jgi:hypothetical protein
LAVAVEQLRGNGIEGREEPGIPSPVFLGGK